MITTKEKVDEFKRELKGYSFYKKAIENCNEEIEEIDLKLQGISSPKPKDVIPGASSVRYYTDMKVELIMKKKKVIEEKEYYLKRIKYIEDKLNILDERRKNVLKRIYINHDSFTNVAYDEFVSVSALQRSINSSIKEIIML